MFAKLSPESQSDTLYRACLGFLAYAQEEGQNLRVIDVRLHNAVVLAKVAIGNINGISFDEVRAAEYGA